ILLGKLTGCIKMKACGSGKTTPYIYLAYFFGDGMHIIMPVNFFTSGYPFLVSFPFSPFMAFIIAQRNTHINGMGIIGSRTKYIEGFIKSKSPGVVAGAGEQLKGYVVKICVKSVEALTKFKRFSPNGAFEA